MSTKILTVLLALAGFTFVGLDDPTYSAFAMLGRYGLRGGVERVVRLRIEAHGGATADALAVRTPVVQRAVDGTGRELEAYDPPQPSWEEHPGYDLPRAYSSRGFLAGFAQAYSRRLINDSYRGFDRPTWSDRIALAKHYAGMNLINLRLSCLRPGWEQWNFACGYAWGTWRGIFQPPTARRLAPGVDWRHDASECLRRIVLLSREVVCG